jgi:ribonuclease BN (tRNA processing enzyme)
MDDPFFPVDLDGLPVHLEIHEFLSGSTRTVGPYRVSATSIFHPAPALAYRIEADSRSIVYATDTEDPFSGQANPVIELARNADALIHDGQYLDADFKPGWGHSTVATALDVAKRANVKRLILYHHDPDRTDDALDRIGVETQHAADALGRGLEVIVAREGAELAI